VVINQQVQHFSLIFQIFATDKLTVWRVDCIPVCYDGNRTVHWQTNSWSVRSRTGQLTDWATRRNVWFQSCSK